jgi:hypothetical protein
MTQQEASARQSRRLLHLAFGGESTDIDSHEFRDPVTVDGAETRLFVVHLRRFLEPKGLMRKPA